MCLLLAFDLDACITRVSWIVAKFFVDADILLPTNRSSSSVLLVDSYFLLARTATIGFVARFLTFPTCSCSGDLDLFVNLDFS